MAFSQNGADFLILIFIFFCNLLKKYLTRPETSNVYRNSARFFADIGRPTALYFFENYPLRKYLKGKTVEDLKEELVSVSHNRWSTKTCENILNAIETDKVKENDYQDARDMVTLGIISDIKHYDKHG